jgi:hypothetical protein
VVQNNVPFTFQDISVTGTLVHLNGMDTNPGTVENFSGGPAGTFEIHLIGLNISLWS